MRLRMGKIGPIELLPKELPMSAPQHDEHSHQPQDAVEAIVPLMPVVLPIMGAVLMFLLAFIAVMMA